MLLFASYYDQVGLSLGQIRLLTLSVPVLAVAAILAGLQPGCRGVVSQGQNSPALATIDLSNGALVGTMALDNTPRALNVSPDGQELFFTEAGVNAVQMLDLATNAIVDQIPVGASPHLPSFTPDGNLGLLVAQGPGEPPAVYEAQTGARSRYDAGRHVDVEGRAHATAWTL